MLDLVGCRLHLESIFAERVLWEIQDGGVVHEDVHGGNFFPVENIGRRFTDRFLAGEVQLEGTVVYFWKVDFECINTFLDSSWIMALYDEMRWRL